MNRIEKKVFSISIAAELKRLGFEVIRTEPNINKPNLDVFVFEDTPEFQMQFENIKAKHMKS